MELDDLLDSNIDIELLKEFIDEDEVVDEKEVDETEIIYFTGKKKELTTYQKFLLKKYPNKYKRKKHKDTVEERLAKRAEQMEEREKKIRDYIWEEYDMMLKNPKKYYKKKNGMTKKEKAILKFFNEKSKEKPKGKKAKELAERKKFALKSASNYFFIKEQDYRFESLLSKNGYIGNPNKRFVKSAAAKTYDAKKVALLKTLEEEIMDQLACDPLSFKPDNVVVEYNDYSKAKKEKKKRKGLQIERLLL